MASQNTQFYKGSVAINGNYYPIMPGVTFNVPRNLYVPPIVGNNWQFNEGDGLRVPIVDCEFVFRDDTGPGSGAIDAALFALALTRTNDVAHDTSPFDIVFFDGRRQATLHGGKFDSFVLSCAKGENISLRARFCGAGIDFLTTSSGSYPAWSKRPLLRYKAVSFLTTQLQNRVWRFALSFTNNHNPDLALDGTNFPMAQNAGFMQCNFSFMVQAADADDINTNLFAMDSGSPGGQISFQLAGINFPALTFTMPNVITDSDQNQALTMPRVMRAYDCVCLGANSQTTGPLQIA